MKLQIIIRLTIALCAVSVGVAAKEEVFTAKVFAGSFAAPLLHGSPAEEEYPLDLFNQGIPHEPIAPQTGIFGGSAGMQLRFSHFLMEGRALMGVGTSGRFLFGGGGDFGVVLNVHHALLLGGQGWGEMGSSVDGLGVTFGPGYLWTPTNFLRIAIRPHAAAIRLADDVRITGNGEFRGGHDATWLAFVPSLEIGFTYP